MGTPDGWTRLTLGQVAQWGSGGTPKAGTAAYYDGEIPWAVIGDLTDGFVSATAARITQLGLAESSAKMVPDGSVLVAMYGSIGKLGLPTIQMATNQAIAFATPHPEVLDRNFLFWYLMSQREILARSGKGATQQNISQTILKSWPIPLPPLDEQRRIVAILEGHLGRLEAGNAAIRRSGSLVERLVSASAKDLWMNASRAGEMRPVGGLGRLFTGSTPSTKRSDFYGDAIPFVTPSDIGGGCRVTRWSRGLSELGGQHARLTEGPSVLAVCIGATLGKVGWSDARLATNQQVNVLEPNVDAHSPEFIAALLASPDFQRAMWSEASSTTLPILNKSRFGQLLLPVPPLEVQHALLESHDGWVDGAGRVGQAIAVLGGRSEATRRSLLQAAFSGQLTRESISV